MLNIHRRLAPLYRQHALVLGVTSSQPVPLAAVRDFLPRVEWRPGRSLRFAWLDALTGPALHWLPSRHWCGCVPAAVATNRCRPRAEVAAVESFVLARRAALDSLRRRYGECTLWLGGFATTTYDPDLRYWRDLDFGLLELRVAPQPATDAADVRECRQGECSLA
jgi:hypothetical protein